MEQDINPGEGEVDQVVQTFNINEAIAPTDDEHDRVVRQSLRQWSSYLARAGVMPHFPTESFDLRALLGNTPYYLDQDIDFGFAKTHVGGLLFLKGQSIWKASNGDSSLKRVIRKDLLLACELPDKVEFPATFTPPSNDETHITVLFLAWAYILSAKWAELINRSRHACHVRLIGPGDPEYITYQTLEQSTIEVDIGRDSSQAEASWWSAILFCGGAWKIAYRKERQHPYFAPWCLSPRNQSIFSISNPVSIATTEPPSLQVALDYVSRYCQRHGLSHQSSVAVASALLIPQMVGRPIVLPLHTHGLQFPPTQSVASIVSLFQEFEELLPCCMTLSSNIWGVRSLLYGTFFNPDIACNLVSAWMNPVLAIVEHLVKTHDFSRLAKFLAIRRPRFGLLWLGAIMMGLNDSVFADIEAGCTIVDIHVAGWTDPSLTFLTHEIGANDGNSIRREDECRLMFLTDSNFLREAPIHPWKPFGETLLCDTQTRVQTHADQVPNSLKYQYWEWLMVTSGQITAQRLEMDALIEDLTEEDQPQAPDNPFSFNFDLSSQLLSRMCTRSIFNWLRPSGFSANERHLYQHSWIEVEREELDEPARASQGSGTVLSSGKLSYVEKWRDFLKPPFVPFETSTPEMPDESQNLEDMPPEKKRCIEDWLEDN